MISAAGVPVIDADPDALDARAAALDAAGSAFDESGADLHSTWQGLAAHYRAPEADQLLAATGPAQTIAGAVGEDVTTVGAALAMFAGEVRELRTQLDTLRGAAAEFESAMVALPDWTADPANVDRNDQLVGEVNAAVAAYEEAQRRCANAIAALHGGMSYRPSDDDGIATASEYGWTAQQLDTAADTPVGLPWGGTAFPDDEEIDEGNWLADAGHTVLDVAGLIPVFGEPADAVNAGWYAAEGDHVNAGLSAAGIVPFVGWAATGGKLGLRGLDAVTPPPAAARTFVTTPRGTTFDIPPGWTSGPARNGRGIVYQRPGAPGNADSIRIMEPTDRYPNGYFRYYNREGNGQPLDVRGRPGNPTDTHIPEDFTGPIEGWPK